MARVIEFKHKNANYRIHPTQVVCAYSIQTSMDGKKLIQLDTYGSDQREIPNKLSQTLQFDAFQAKKLWDILGHEFGFKSSS